MTAASPFPHLDIEPALQDWLQRDAALKAQIPAPAEPMDLAARRERELRISDALAEEFAGPVHEDAEISEVEIAGLPALRVRPRSADSALPTQVFLHGGGFVSGTVRERLNAVTLSQRAVRSGVQIVAIEYRLAPEHPYPAAVEDAIGALRALAEEPTLWGAGPSRLGLGGNSAGGQIAAVAALRLRDAQREDPAALRLRHLLLEVPALDFSADWPSMQALTSEADRRGAELVAGLYAGAALWDPYLSPARAEDLTSLPRTYVMTAELDPLRDAAEAFAERIVAAGGDAALRRGEGQMHGTTGLAGTSRTARAWQEAAVSELRAALAGPEH